VDALYGHKVSNSSFSPTSLAHNIFAALSKFHAEVQNITLCSGFFRIYKDTHKHGLSCNPSTEMKLKIITTSSKGPWVRCVDCFAPSPISDMPWPSDLNTMEHKLETNQYSSLRGFIDDAQLVFDNCRLYNPEGSVYAKNATRMEKFLKDQVAERMRTEA
jgi:hypothetical protein